MRWLQKFGVHNLNSKNLNVHPGFRVETLRLLKTTGWNKLKGGHEQLILQNPWRVEPTLSRPAALSKQIRDLQI
jgi:hypothetical protein